jgi:hypothetical protein
MERSEEAEFSVTTTADSFSHSYPTFPEFHPNSDKRKLKDVSTVPEPFIFFANLAVNMWVLAGSAFGKFFGGEVLSSYILYNSSYSTKKDREIN